MKKEEKNAIIDQLAAQIKTAGHIYLTDISQLDAEKTTALRRACFNKEIKLQVVKNALLAKAFQRVSNEFEPLHSVLKGQTAVMFCQVANVPAQLIKEFHAKYEKPVFKAGFVQDCAYVGANQLEALIHIKSKNELLGEIIGLLQSPIQNVISSLQSGGTTIMGVLETLSKR